MKNFLVFIVTFLFLFQWSQARQKYHRNPCLKGHPLTDNHGKRIKCHGSSTSCPNGYECQSRLCCPVSTPDPITTTYSTPVTCPDFPDCRDGIIVDDEFGCPLCLIIDSCPGFPCPEFESCFPTNNTLPNNVRVGMCYANPCSYGSPLEDQLGFSILCDFNENYSVCPDEYICTPTAINGAVCCSSATTSTEVTTSHCPPINDCASVIFNSTAGCPMCLDYDTCIQIPCSEDHYCLVEDATINKWKASCVSKPCSYLKPYENESGVTTLCTTDSSKCPNGFACSTVPNDFDERRVCCPLSLTTTSTYPDSTTN